MKIWMDILWHYGKMAFNVVWWVLVTVLFIGVMIGKYNSDEMLRIAVTFVILTYITIESRMPK